MIRGQQVASREVIEWILRGGPVFVGIVDVLVWPKWFPREAQPSADDVQKLAAVLLRQRSQETLLRVADLQDSDRVDGRVHLLYCPGN